MNIRVSRVCSDDVQFLWRLMNDKDILYFLNEVPTQPEDWIKIVASWEDDPDEEDYIIFEGETPVGWLGINGLLSENRKAYVKMLALLPRYQGKGIGTYIIRKFTAILKSRGFTSIALYTDQDNYSAQSCYAKNGFKVTEKLIQKMTNGNFAERYKMEIVF